MAGYIKVEVEKPKLQPINTKINSKIFEQFQIKCKQQNIPMNVVVEAFVRQYINGKYELYEENILKWKGDINEDSTLNTPINKDIYTEFKEVVKSQKFFVKHVLSAFIEDYAKNDIELILVKHNK